MEDRGLKYEHKTIKAVRGTEARSIAKWEQQGWELDAQKPGTLRTELVFRKPKEPFPFKPLAALGAIIVVLFIGLVISSILEEDDSEPAAAPAQTPEPAEPSGEPSEELSAAPSESASEPSPTPAEEEPLTPRSNPEFATILQGDNCGPQLRRFAEKYEGRTVEFDGSVAAVANHGDFDTRFDFLIAPGDAGAESAVGPSFKFEDVNFFDLNVSGTDSISLDDRLRVTAVIQEYNSGQCVLLLDPVATSAR